MVSISIIMSDFFYGINPFFSFISLCRFTVSDGQLVNVCHFSDETQHRQHFSAINVKPLFIVLVRYAHIFIFFEMGWETRQITGPAQCGEKGSVRLTYSCRLPGGRCLV